MSILQVRNKLKKNINLYVCIFLGSMLLWCFLECLWHQTTLVVICIAILHWPVWWRFLPIYCWFLCWTSERTKILAKKVKMTSRFKCNFKRSRKPNFRYLNNMLKNFPTVRNYHRLCFLQIWTKAFHCWQYDVKWIRLHNGCLYTKIWRYNVV